MSQSNEDDDLAVLFGNTKKKKRTVDLLTLAKSCDSLVRKRGSRTEVANRLGLSSEMIRELLIPLSLPKEVQNLISERRIDSIDVVREIAAIKDQSKQIQAAHLFLKLPTRDIRDIKKLVKESGISVEEATDSVLKFRERDMHVFIIDLDDLTYEKIQVQAKKIGLSPAILVKGLIQSWMKSFENN